VLGLGYAWSTKGGTKLPLDGEYEMKYYFSVRHASENALEEYALGRLLEPELASLEEHLLLCDECRERLRAVDEFIQMLRVGLAAAGDRTKAASR